MWQLHNLFDDEITAQQSEVPRYELKPIILSERREGRTGFDFKRNKACSNPGIKRTSEPPDRARSDNNHLT
jgi:hypothetical protein